MLRKSALNQMPYIFHTIFVTKTSTPQNPSELLLLLLLETAVVQLASFHISTTYPRRLMKFLLYQYGDNHHYGLFISLIVSFSVQNQFILVLNFYQSDHNHESQPPCERT